MILIWLFLVKILVIFFLFREVIARNIRSRNLVGLYGLYLGVIFVMRFFCLLSLFSMCCVICFVVNFFCMSVVDDGSDGMIRFKILIVSLFANGKICIMNFFVVIILYL